MEPEAVRELYDTNTAKTYDERWHGNPWGNDTEHLAEALGRRIYPGVRWLDVGCGTGHFLSRFPGIDRAGTDLSPSMLAEATEASPDALFFKEWDFRNDNPDWHDGFTLVTSTGQPWSYVDTVGELEQVMENLARWTAPGGTCMVLAKDELDLTGTSLPYHIPGEPGFPGEIVIKAVVWSLVDRSHEHIPEVGAKYHHDMIWPQIDHWVATLGLYFRTVIVELLPHDPEWLNTPRRLIIARDKRAEGDVTPVKVIHTDAGAAYAETVAPTPASPQPADAAAAPPPAQPEPQPVAAEAPVAPEPSEAIGDHVPRLRDLPVSHLVSKFRPWEISFWRTVARRATRGTKR